MPRAARIAFACLLLTGQTAWSDVPSVLKEPRARGVASQAQGKVVIDGKLDDWSGAFCTPVAYNHNNLANRAAQFFYLWDEEAFYLGLRALDTKMANVGGKTSLYNGDAVEFYMDARSGDAFRGKDWSTGAIHLHITPFEKDKVAPRWAVRQGIATSGVELKGVEIAATTGEGYYEMEFKIPWANFPGFAAKSGAQIGIDAELCSGDGGARTDRTFAYGSPLSVQQPASMARVELIVGFPDSYLPALGPAMFPMWVDTPWSQPERGRVRVVVAIPPGYPSQVGKVEIRIHDADGRVIGTHEAMVESFGPEGLGFARAVAGWSIDAHAPNTYFATAKVESKAGKVLATVTPRMVQEGILSGR